MTYVGLLQKQSLKSESKVVHLEEKFREHCKGVEKRIRGGEKIIKGVLMSESYL